jgi:hypothetical protein
MKLNNNVIKDIKEAMQPLEEIGGVNSTEEYIYNLTYLEMMIRERIKNAREHLEGV